ncbi:MAG: acyltransferase family protein [Thermodesulfobacteriota bacterium]|nr:MAG: acyltransferase family protein [Thermodesulfobacteriota bacterium]
MANDSGGAERKDHLVWPDVLKIAAVYAVIVIHTAAPYLLLGEAGSLYRWWAGNIYDSISRWCIPVFVMLSGFFLIGNYRDEKLGSFFMRRFSRVLVPLLIWSLIYFLWRIYANNEDLSFSYFIPMLLKEPVYYHLWFMYLILGLYILTPVIGLYARGTRQRHLWYYLALWVALAPGLTFIDTWCGVATYLTPDAGNSVFNFVGYFALGWMLKDLKLTPLKKSLFLLLFLFGLFITAYGTYIASVIKNNGQFSGIFYEYFSFSVLLMSVSIYVLVKGLRLSVLSGNPGYLRKLIRLTAACVPGIYLVHAIFIAVAKRGMLGFRFTPDLMDPFIGIPVFALGIFLASLSVVMAIKVLPLVKYTVPAVLILVTVLNPVLYAAEETGLIEKEEFKTLTRLAKTPLRGMPERDAWKKAVPQVSMVSIESSHDWTSQPALFYDSGSPRKKPLLIVLHSWSEDYLQSFGIPYGLWAVKNDWVFIQPDFRGAFTNPLSTASEPAVKDILDALAYAERSARIDESRIYLAGFSGGGMAALLMAGRFPEKWAGVVAWGAVYDLVDWYAHTRNATHDYSSQIASSCGGPPLSGTAHEAECRRRSPSTYLENARGKVPVYIAVGSEDKFVPPAHSLRAFNDLADEEDRFSEEEIEYVSRRHALPSGLGGVAYSDRLYEDAGVPFLYERESESAVVKIYKGSHDVVYNAGLAWLAGQKR